MFVKGGFAEINPETLTVLAERAFDPSKSDKATVTQELARAEKELAEAKNDDDRFVAQSAIDALRSIAA